MEKNNNFDDTNSETSSVSSVVSEISENSSYRFLRYEFVTGHRITSKLLYTCDEKQFYRFNSKNKSGDAYLCAEKLCKCRVLLRNDKLCIQPEKYCKHNHETKGEKFEELKVLNIIKEKCADISTLINEKKQSVRDIFYSVVSKHPDVKLEFYSIERSLQIIRNSALPKNPTNCDEISNIFERDDIYKLLGTSKDDKPFFNGAVEGNGYSFCIFSSHTSINLYKSRTKAENRIIMMDGTFAVVPIGTFDQLLVIYAVYMEKVAHNLTNLNSIFD